MTDLWEFRLPFQNRYLRCLHHTFCFNMKRINKYETHFSVFKSHTENGVINLKRKELFQPYFWDKLVVNWPIDNSEPKCMWRVFRYSWEFRYSCSAYFSCWLICHQVDILPYFLPWHTDHVSFSLFPLCRTRLREQ